MKMRYGILILGLYVGWLQSGEQRVGGIGTDFDKVLTIPSKIDQFMNAMKILGFNDTMRVLWFYGTSSKVRNSVNAAWEADLKDVNGLPVIGSEAYINHIFKDMSFISEEKKKAMARVELLFKPNVPLIEYYQRLQDQGFIVYVWTDNDQGGYERKLHSLNEELKKLGKKLFIPDGFHCAMVGTKERGYSKVHPEYFRAAYEQMMVDQGKTLLDKTILFLDDKIKNVQSALEAKSKYGLNLDAIVYDSKKTELSILENKIGVAK